MDGKRKIVYGCNKERTNTNEEIYYIEYKKYRKFVNPKVSCNFNKTLVRSIICSKCSNDNDRVFKKQEIFVALNG